MSSCNNNANMTTVTDQPSRSSSHPSCAVRVLKQTPVPPKIDPLFSEQLSDLEPAGKETTLGEVGECVGSKHQFDDDKSMDCRLCGDNTDTGEFHEGSQNEKKRGDDDYYYSRDMHAVMAGIPGMQAMSRDGPVHVPLLHATSANVAEEGKGCATASTRSCALPDSSNWNSCSSQGGAAYPTSAPFHEVGTSRSTCGPRASPCEGRLDVATTCTSITQVGELKHVHVHACNSFSHCVSAHKKSVHDNGSLSEERIGQTSCSKSTSQEAKCLSPSTDCQLPVIEFPPKPCFTFSLDAERFPSAVCSFPFSSFRMRDTLLTASTHTSKRFSCQSNSSEEAKSSESLLTTDASNAVIVVTPKPNEAGISCVDLGEATLKGPKGDDDSETETEGGLLEPLSAGIVAETVLDQHGGEKRQQGRKRRRRRRRRRLTQDSLMSTQDGSVQDSHSSTLEQDISTLEQERSTLEQDSSIQESSTQESLNKNIVRTKKSKNVYPNAFVSVRISSGEIRSKIEEIQAGMLTHDKKLKSTLVSSKKLHLTLMVVWLEDEEAIERCVMHTHTHTHTHTHECMHKIHTSQELYTNLCTYV